MGEQNIDQALVTQVLRGDKEAFSVLVMKYERKISRLIGGIIDDKSVISDLTQEVFIKAYRGLKNFRGKSTFYTWMYRIAVNTAKNYAKSSFRMPVRLDLDFLDIENLSYRSKLQDQTTPEEMLISDEMSHVLFDALNELPNELRTSIILREMAGLSYEEIAKVMRCPIGTVRSRISRARSTVDAQIKIQSSSY